MKRLVYFIVLLTAFACKKNTDIPNPKVVEDPVKFIIAMTDQGLTALDTLGKVKWAYNEKFLRIFHQPKVVGSSIYASVDVDGKRSILIINAETGLPTVRLPLQVGSDFNVADDIVIVAGYDDLYAYDLKLNTVTWRRFVNKKVYNTGYPSSLITVANGRYYQLENNTQLICGDILTGKVLWSLDFNESERFTSLNQKIVVQNGQVFVPTERMITAFNEKDGSKMWSYANSNDRGFYLTYRADTLFSGSGGNLAAFNPKTGTKFWNYAFQYNRYGVPFLYKNGIYFGGALIVAHSTNTGKQIWSSYAAVNALDIVVAQNLLICFDGININALNATSGTFKWKYTSQRSLFTFSPFVITQSGKAIQPF